MMKVKVFYKIKQISKNNLLQVLYKKLKLQDKYNSIKKMEPHQKPKPQLLK